MQTSLIPGKLKVFESDGFFCASFVSPGYPMLAARDDDFVELAEWLLDIGVQEEVFEMDLPIEASVSLPKFVVMPSAQTLERRFSREASYLQSNAAFHPPN